MDYDSMKTQKKEIKESKEGNFEKRLLLLSPDMGRSVDGK
jgi:hypothetical protein